MQISRECLDLLHHYESCSLDAYPDPGSRDGTPWTIGWGRTGPEVRKGLKWTQAQADEALHRDLQKFSTGVLPLVKVDIKQCEFDALVCFAFNVGIGALAKSTLLRKLNAGDSAGAADEFLRWNKNDGKVMRGLTRRRAAERAMFNGSTAKFAIQIGAKAA